VNDTGCRDNPRIPLRSAGANEKRRCVLAKLRERLPGLKVTLQEVDQRGAERLIAQGDAELVIMAESKLPPGFLFIILIRLPLCLLVRTDQRYQCAAGLLRDGIAGKVPLISLPPHELLARLFQQEMTRRNLVWRTSMETSSHDPVSTYVRNGFGAGLAVLTSHLQRDPEFAGAPAKRLPEPADRPILARKARRDWTVIRRMN